MSDFTQDSFKIAKRIVKDDVIFLICPGCNGEGEWYGSHRCDCKDCKGTGSLTIEDFNEKVQKHEQMVEKLRLRDEIKSMITWFNVDALNKLKMHLEVNKKDYV